MTQEKKDLLLKDLCSRLPYGVKVEIKYYDDAWKLLAIYTNGTTYAARDIGYPIETYFENCKPYLFPLSSMTEEQRVELYKTLCLGYESHYHLSKEWEDFNDSIDNNDLFLPASWVSDLNKMYSWLNKKHFDYRGLIPMGLAIDATGLNIY